MNFFSLRFNSTFFFILVGLLSYHDVSGQAFCESPNAQIVDNFTTSRDLIVSGTIGSITDLDVYIDIGHPWLEDLSIWLKSPNGTIVYLYDQNCISEQNILTYFDDEGSALACPPTGGGSTIPVELLSAFDGQSLNGTWTIYVQDHYAVDVGYLYTWCLYATLDLDEGCALSVSPELAIGDNQTISSQIEVSNTYGTITDVNVRVGLTHTWIGDLKIWVVSPAGTSVDLFNLSCGTAENIATYFDDEGSALACPPVNGVLTIPTSSLSAFDGEELNGTWTIYIQDNASNDIGTFHGWCLEPTIESSCSEYSNTPLTAIEDLQTISDQITVSGVSGIITDLDVRVGITHTWIGDLNIRVQSPSGTVVDLYNRDCGYNISRFENIETYFNDEGTSLTCPPTNGVLTIPVSSLSAFDGESLNGTWTIYVHDSVLYDAGIFNGWCLIPTLGECVSDGHCDDGSPCTSDFCQNNTCHHDCNLHINNVDFNANSFVGCSDGTVSATVGFSTCSSPWTAYLRIGNTVHRSWLISQGASVYWDNIPAGNYIMTADGDGCTDTTNIPIGVGVPCSMQFENADSSHSTPTSVQGCVDGSINASVNAFVCGGALAWTTILYDNLSNVVNSFSPTSGSAMLWENLPSGDYRIVASANSSSCNTELNVTVPSGPACRLEIQNVQNSVGNCDNNSITADISVLTCNGSWYAYLYVSDYSSVLRTWDYTQGDSISWSDLPLGNYHLLATNLASCSDTSDVILSCSDGDPCTNDACQGGCSHTYKCEDNNPCTEDFCQANGTCLNQPIICNDANDCTNDACVNGACVTTPINCADNNACTVDQCFNGNCTHTIMVCNDNNACTNDFCQSGNCIFQPLCILDDNNPCTDDHCVNRTCLHPPKNCSDNNSCTTDQCQAGLCVNNPVCIVNDGNPCTIDRCINGSCVHNDTCTIEQCTVDANCNDDDLCTNDTCIAGDCEFIPLNCDDGVSCTNDHCDSLSGNCLSVASCNIDDGDLCTLDGCVNGACLHAPKNCDDASSCTSDFCQSGNCIFQPLCVLDDLDACTNDFCISGQCIHQDIFCNDGLLCTIDSCIGGNCVYNSITCDDGNPCTTDSCLNGNCISTLIPGCEDPCDTVVCIDGDLCTTDSCSNGNCIFSLINCDDSNPCTADSCESGTCGHLQLNNCNLTISGSIVSESGIPIPTVTVSLTGAGNQNFITSNDGLFNFNVTQGDDCIITPSKSNDSITNNGVSTLDIVLMQRQILAVLELSSPYKKIAADVNNSESVTTLDIVLTRAVILQSLHTFPNGRLWAFVSSDFSFDSLEPPFPFESFRSYSNISAPQPSQNFIAIKLGDVNNSWNPNIAKTGTVGDVQFIVNDYNAMPGEEIIVPVKVRDFDKITGYQFTLSWNPEVLQLIEASNSSLNGFFGMNSTPDGLLTTLWFDELTKEITLLEDKSVFDLKFKVTGEVGTYSDIIIGSDLTAAEAYNENLDLLSIAPTNGKVKVEDVSTNDIHQSPINLQVQPNPFSNSTNIIFAIPQDENVSILIYDLLGKEVKHIMGDFKSGEHFITWAGDDNTGRSLSKGIYHVRLITGDYSQGLKVLLIN